MPLYTASAITPGLTPVATSSYVITADTDVLGYYDALDTANITTAQSTVSAWVASAGSYGTISSSGTPMPAHTSSGTSGKVTFDATDDYMEAAVDPLALQASLATVNIPDASNGDSGKGFTCTGLSKAFDGTWWVGNDGRNVLSGGNGLQLPSLVHLSAGFTTKLGEILLTPLFPSIGSIQGVAVDLKDGSIWFASLDEGMVRHVTADGVHINSFSATTPNGLTIDTIRDELIVAASPTSTTVKWYTRNGAVTQTKTFSGAITDPDHIWFNPYDGPQGQIWCTQGANDATGNLYIFDVASSIALGPGTAYSLTAGGVAANAVEGLHYDFATRVLTVMNDGYFHGVSASPLNRALQYTMLPTLGTRFACFGVMKWTAVQSTNNSAFTLGNPVATANYGGVGLFNTANLTNVVRVFSQTGTTAGSQDIISFAVNDNQVKSFYWMEFDYIAKTVVMYINGVRISSGALTNSLGVGFTGRKAMLGARRADSTGALSNYSNMEISCIGWKRNFTYRADITTQLMTKHGLQ